MIIVTRLGGPQVAVNADLIERVEADPVTVITLVDGTRYEVAEPVEDVVAKVRDFRAGVLIAADTLAGTKSGRQERQPAARLRVLHPPARRPQREAAADESPSTEHTE